MLVDNCWRLVLTKFSGIGEKQIDSSYSNDLYNFEGCRLFRKDCKKGGGGILAYITLLLTSKKIKLPREYKTIEALAIEINVAGRESIILGIYRPPKSLVGDYFLKLDEELNHIFMWSTTLKQHVVVVRDLNLDRMRVDKREEEGQG